MPWARYLDSALNVDLIATPAPLTVALNDSAAAVAVQMAETGYDVLPVDQSFTAYWLSPHLLDQPTADQPVRFPLSVADLISADSSILDVIELMATNRRSFYFVLSGARISGILTYADLNRQPVRAALFALVVEAEEAMRAACTAVADDESWLAVVPPDARGRIESEWKKAKDQGIELAKIQYASLRNLGEIMRDLREIDERLRRMVTDDWDSQLRDLVELRNRIAHPGNALVHRPSDVDARWKSCLLAGRILGALTSGVR